MVGSIGYGCQRNENSFSGSIFSIVISNGRFSYPLCRIFPWTRAPTANEPLGSTPNQVPNSLASVRALHTRERGARIVVLFWIRSVVVMVMAVLHWSVVVVNDL